MTPNQITLIRIFLVPFMIFFYLADFIPYGKLIAVIIFAVAAITDFIDGKLARKTGQVTDLGKFLDPIADKLLIVGALVLVITDAMVIANWAVWAGIIAIIILAREFMVTGLRQVAASKNIIISADNWGKYKAFIQDLALPAFMLLSFFNQYEILTGSGLSAFAYVCFVLIITATILTIISGVNYFIKNWKVFEETEQNTTKNAITSNGVNFEIIEDANSKTKKIETKKPVKKASQGSEKSKSNAKTVKTKKKINKN